MQKKCKTYQEIMRDIFYEEAQMTNEIELHKECCKECFDFWYSLEVITLNLPRVEVPIVVDEVLIKNAFRAAKVIKDKKNRLTELCFFMLLSAVLLSCTGVLVKLGYGFYVACIQMIAMMIAPFILLALTIKRKMKEGY